MVAGADLTGNDLFPRFSQAEFDRRHRAVRQAMAREDLEAILVYGGPGAPEVAYLINYLPASPCCRSAVPSVGGSAVPVQRAYRPRCARHPQAAPLASPETAAVR